MVFKLRLPGQYEDSETGTHYNYLRDYDPQTGWYLTRDPISINGGLNTYLYANADPLNSVDVLGLKPELIEHEGRQGYYIDAQVYDSLHASALAGDGIGFYSTLWNLTGDLLYFDLGSSYDRNILTVAPALLLLRDLYMRIGTNNIERVDSVDDTPIYFLEESGAIGAAICNVAGFQSAFYDAAAGLISLGAGLVDLQINLTGGAAADLFGFVFGEDSVPAWAPSFVVTAASLRDTGYQIAQAIRDNP